MVFDFFVSHDLALTQRENRFKGCSLPVGHDGLTEQHPVDELRLDDAFQIVHGLPGALSVDALGGAHWPTTLTYTERWLLAGFHHDQQAWGEVGTVREARIVRRVCLVIGFDADPRS